MNFPHDKQFQFPFQLKVCFLLFPTLDFDKDDGIKYSFGDFSEITFPLSFFGDVELCGLYVKLKKKRGQNCQKYFILGAHKIA